MPRDRDMDNASSSGQSKRPPLSQRDSDSQSDTTNTSGAPSQHPRTKTYPKHHHHVGRLNARVPSTKAFHKYAAAHPQPPKLTRRQTSRPASPTEVERPPHRRATSEVKLAHQATSAQLPKSSSQTNLKRNRSQVEVAKRSRSSDKLKRTSSGTGIHRPLTKTGKTQVHFDLGSDDPDDEWVDASGSNSPHLSRKGSVNSSAHSSLRPSTENSRPVTPSAPSQAQQRLQHRQRQQQQEQPREEEVGGGGEEEHHHHHHHQQQQPPPLKQQQQQHKQPQSQKPQQPQPQIHHSASPASKDISQHKEYLTSRLLQRIPPQSAPPKMTADMAKGAPAQPTDRTVTSLAGSSNQDELVSRFVNTPGSGLTSQGSFYQQPNHSTRQNLDDVPLRHSSMANLNDSTQKPESDTLATIEQVASALVPKSCRRTAALPAETSRTQQKLNLQRASSALEPGQGLSGAGRGAESSPLIGVGGPGCDGANSRDPRIGKLLERTGMEYLVVRRYQNPVARSLNRLGRLPGMDNMRRIPRTPAGSINGKRGYTLEDNARHARNVSMPDPRQTTPRTGSSTRAAGSGASIERDSASRVNGRLSGISPVGANEEDEINTLLRNLWEKSMDLSASTD